MDRRASQILLTLLLWFGSTNDIIMSIYYCNSFVLHGRRQRRVVQKYARSFSFSRFEASKSLQGVRLYSTVHDEDTVTLYEYATSHQVLDETENQSPPKPARRAIAPCNPVADQMKSKEPVKLSLEDALQRKGDEIFDGLISRPIADGNWVPENPLDWTKKFGRRSSSKDKEFAVLANLKPGDEGYFDVSNVTVENVTIVRTVEQAEIVLERLMNADTSIMHACDTEVMGIDLGKVGPVGNGYVTCASVYSGPDFDYGLGEKPGSVLWIDNLDDAFGILQVFKPWFEDKRFLKVWHNFGFDRHVMWNEGIDVQGFGGDTMHMARLQDTGRAKYGAGRGYGLEALTEAFTDRRKKPMKEIFGVPRLRKDGSPGSIVDLPPVEVMQRDPKFRVNWILYSAYDAEGTWLIREKLQEKLEKMPWTLGENLYYYYFHYLREFGEVLTDMERRGIRVDAKDYLASVEVQARKDRKFHVAEFRKWAAKLIGPDGLALNPASSLQLNIFLFGGAENRKTREPTDSIRTLKIPREEVPDNAIEALKMRDEVHAKAGENSVEETPDSFDMMTAVQLKTLCKGK